MTRYFDRDGNEHDEAWWRSIYGEGARVVQGTGDWVITELWDSGDNAGMDFQVHGLPRDVVPVLRNGGMNALTWKDERGGYFEGLVFACYAPPGMGAYDLIVQGGDVLIDFGWICKTNHRHPQKIVYSQKQPGTFTLDLLTVGDGLVMANPVGPYAPGSTVTLTAHPADGWRFMSWNGDWGGSDNPTTLVMDGNKVVTATFEPVTDPCPRQEIIEEMDHIDALLAEIANSVAAVRRLME